jgi:DNA invertase Pin-like site-specific DNA recombinase
VDTGFSGAQASRPRLDQLLRDARLRKFEAVLVWKLDRWGRSVAHCVRSIQDLVSLGIRFLSPTESIDTGADSPMSKFLMHLFAAFAEMERGIIRERVCAGVRAAKAKGTRLGRPRRVFRRDEALRLETTFSGHELAKSCARAKSADVHRDRRLPTVFGKPSRGLARATAQTQAVTCEAFTVRQTHGFRTP